MIDDGLDQASLGLVQGWSTGAVTIKMTVHRSKGVLGRKTNTALFQQQSKRFRNNGLLWIAKPTSLRDSGYDTAWAINESGSMVDAALDLSHGF